MNKLRRIEDHCSFDRDAGLFQKRHRANYAHSAAAAVSARPIEDTVARHRILNGNDPMLGAIKKCDAGRLFYQAKGLGVEGDLAAFVEARICARRGPVFSSQLSSGSTPPCISLRRSFSLRHRTADGDGFLKLQVEAAVVYLRCNETLRRVEPDVMVPAEWRSVYSPARLMAGF